MKVLILDIRYLILSIISSLMFLSAYSQDERKLIQQGNADFKKKNYSDAETNYRKSLEKNPQSATGAYNLGNALYKQGKEEEAEQYFSGSASMEKDKKAQAEAYYNLGNAKMKAQKYKESVDAYKQALKLNDKDEDARYNLAYALSKLRQQQQQQQQQKGDNKDQNKEKDQQQKQQDQQQKKQDQQQQQQDQQAQKKEKISKDDAERMLQALKNDEKKLQKKLAKKFEATTGSTEKDW